MSDHGTATWKPGPADTGQADECTRERAALKELIDGQPDHVRLARSRRALELERVAAETRRAAVAVADDDVWVSGSGLTTAIAALNLMGIPTLLPGEHPFDVSRDMAEGVRIYLRGPRPGDTDDAEPADRLDALSGLIEDFRRAGVYLSGLRIKASNVEASNVEASSVEASTTGGCVLVAAHRAVMAAFGEFLARKYVAEGWRLV